MKICTLHRICFCLLHSFSIPILTPKTPKLISNQHQIQNQQPKMANLTSVVPDDRKRKRMVSNRESARRSRMKKQQHMEELITEISRLQNENKQFELQANLIAERFNETELQNSAIRAEMAQLTERLKSANMYLSLVEVVSGVKMDIEEIPDLFEKIPDPFINPWLPAFNGRQIGATADEIY
ncbi:hypothetical protein LUZ60_003488 [Juncus effusus]|nr:hypothetical protein LUZ60_003488 [Juncus effusus]